MGDRSSSADSSGSFFVRYAVWINCGLAGTSRGTSRYGRSGRAILVNTGAATSPPPCGYAPGESRDTRMVTAGLLIGAKPMNDAITFVREYLPVAGSIF